MERSIEVPSYRKEVIFMWAFATVLIVLIVSFTLSSLVIIFADSISAYLKAKTEEIQTKTEMLRKEKEREHNS